MYEHINHPGIIFPSKFATARALPKVPRKDLSKWGYETMEIARITGSSSSSVWNAMTRLGISFADGINKNKTRATYWEKKAVDAWLSTRPEVIDSLPDGYMTAREAAGVLRLPEKNIIKHLTRLGITGTRVIVTVNGTKRTRLIFKKAEIEPLTQTKQQ